MSAIPLPLPIAKRSGISNDGIASDPEEEGRGQGAG
jgi:hypothetical protein